MDYYEIIGVAPSSDSSTIKRKFQSLARIHHPDKLPPNTTESDRAQSVQYFQQLEEAWRNLGDSELRKEYDAQRAQQLNQKAPISEDVDLDSMEFEEDEKLYWHPCRCGGRYEVLEEELESGVTLAGCSNCTLAIRLLYSLAPP